jgi:hypothetical protein
MQESELNRTASPLLHDYKPSGDRRPKSARPLQWFAVGLGMPIVAVILALSFKSTPASLPANDSDKGPTSVAELHPPGPIPAADPELLLVDDHGATLSLHEFHPPLFPAPSEYESLRLVVRSGDTLDQLFRKNKLDLGHLAIISRLPDAGAQLRMLRPGDELEIEHENGKLVKLYRKLNLTSALVVNRGENGFTAELVDRPIEVQRRRGYGRINSSLFESANAAGLSNCKKKRESEAKFLHANQRLACKGNK